jgi:hypothetical protein
LIFLSRRRSSAPGQKLPNSLPNLNVRFAGW